MGRSAPLDRRACGMVITVGGCREAAPRFRLPHPGHPASTYTTAACARVSSVLAYAPPALAPVVDVELCPKAANLSVSGMGVQAPSATRSKYVVSRSISRSRSSNGDLHQCVLCG